MRPVLILMVVLAPAAASAQTSDTKAAELAQEGELRMQEGKYPEACEAFAASLELEAVPATQVSLADCREKNGELATAWKLFVDVERATDDDAAQAELHAIVEARAQALEPRVSHLTITVPDESQIEGLVITRNGDPVDAGEWNRAIPLDGGAYKVTGRAPGRESWSLSVDVPPESGHVVVDVPRLELVAIPVDEEAIATSNPSPFTLKRILALGAGALAAGAFVGAIVFSEQANNLQDQGRLLCPSNVCASEEEAAEFERLSDRSDRKMLYAELSLGAAIGCAVGALFLWFNGAPQASSDGAKTGDKNDDDDAAALAPLVTPHATGLSVVGRF